MTAEERELVKDWEAEKRALMSAVHGKKIKSYQVKDCPHCGGVVFVCDVDKIPVGIIDCGLCTEALCRKSPMYIAKEKEKSLTKESEVETNED